MLAGSVIIVTHNSAGSVEACLQSLQGERDWKIVLVDNGSSDETVIIARRVRPAISVLLNGQNLGFAAAVNQGCEVAEGEVLVVLNPDVITRPNSLDKLRNALYEDSVGAVGGMLTDGTDRVQVGFTFRRFPTLVTMLAEVLLLNHLWVNNPLNRSYRCFDANYRIPQDVEQPAGACLAFRRESWMDIGGFDERFFPVWFEDVDFCRRLRDRGWKIRFCPEALFVHEGAHSVSQLTFRARQCFWYRNLLRYFAKHHRYSQTVILRVGILIGLTLRALLSILGFHPAAVSTRESVSAYMHVIWEYAILGRNLHLQEVSPVIASPTM